MTLKFYCQYFLGVIINQYICTFQVLIESILSHSYLLIWVVYYVYFMYVYTHAHVYVQRADISVWSLPIFLSALFFEAKSLNLELGFLLTGYRFARQWLATAH